MVGWLIRVSAASLLIEAKNNWQVGRPQVAMQHYFSPFLVCFSFFITSAFHFDVISLNWLLLALNAVELPVQRPRTPSPVEGPHVCSGVSCYVREKFYGRVQMYDGCCSVG